MVNWITKETSVFRYFLDPLLGAQTYDLSDMFIMAKIKLTDKDGNQIAKNVEASTVNDCLMSAFKSVNMFILSLLGNSSPSGQSISDQSQKCPPMIEKYILPTLGNMMCVGLLAFLGKLLQILVCAHTYISQL